MTKNKLNSEKLQEIFQSYPDVKLVYLFGSQATKNTGPLSDYDFAVYFDNKLGKKEMFDIKFMLQDKLGQKLKTDNIDIVILNLTQSPELKYNIIKNGKLVYETEPYCLIVEPKILNSYFDFVYLLRKHNLTKN